MILMASVGSPLGNFIGMFMGTSVVFVFDTSNGVVMGDSVGNVLNAPFDMVIGY